MPWLMPSYLVTDLHGRRRFVVVRNVAPWRRRCRQPLGDVVAMFDWIWTPGILTSHRKGTFHARTYAYSEVRKRIRGWSPFPPLRECLP